MHTFSRSKENKIQRFHLENTISEPIFSIKDDFLHVEIDDENSYLNEPGNPMLPVVTKSINFPAGTEIIKTTIDITYSEIILNKKIVPSPKPIPLKKELILNSVNDLAMNFTVYDSNNYYPSMDYDVGNGVGLDDGSRVTFVNINCYSKYSPKQDLLKVPKGIDIVVEYRLPSETLFNENKYDMLIITDRSFIDNLQPLVNHKENVGIKVKVESVQDIVMAYDGRDNAEDIKFMIKDSIETDGIKYVLLVGGHVGQTHEWYVPVRYSNNFDGSYTNSGIKYDPQYLSDLYFSDIYKYGDGGSLEFEDWDSNENDIFGEFSRFGINKDIIDFYPDVYLGRLPVRYSWEVDLIVDKIISYEKTASDSWFKNALMIGGDTVPPARDESGLAEDGKYEGEITTTLAEDYLKSKDFVVKKLYTSDGSFSGIDDVINGINEGHGFVFFSGHGDPSLWGNFLPDAQTEGEFIDGLTILDTHRLSNKDKLPIVVIGGCHNAQFNVTMQHILDNKGLNYKRAFFNEWIHQDTCSALLFEEDGGSIASIGGTGLGYGYYNEWTLLGLGGFLNTRFFHAFTNQQKTFLGEAHSQAITDYINKEGSLIEGVNADTIDRKTIEEWVLLGDPSLKIGGYTDILETNSNESRDDSKSKEKTNVGNLDEVEVPEWNKGSSWIYSIDDFNFNFAEISGRDVNLQFKSDDVEFSVIGVTNKEYFVNLIAEDLELFLDLNFDLFNNKKPLKLTLELVDTKMNGEIIFNKDNLGITSTKIEIKAALDTEALLQNINFDIPSIVPNVIKKIPLTISLDLSFDNPFEVFKYPLSIEKGWGFDENIINIEGTVKSPVLRLVSILNKLANIVGVEILPPFLSDSLPIIDIGDILEAYSGSNQIEISKSGEILALPVFVCKNQERVSVEAGDFDTYNLWFIHGSGEFYYSPEAQNIVKISGNFKHYIPIVDNVNFELVKMVN